MLSNLQTTLDYHECTHKMRNEMPSIVQLPLCKKTEYVFRPRWVYYITAGPGKIPHDRCREGKTGVEVECLGGKRVGFTEPELRLNAGRERFLLTPQHIYKNFSTIHNGFRGGKSTTPFLQKPEIVADN